MNVTIQPRLLEGTVSSIPSKSVAHRLLICAAFANNETVLVCPDTNRDIEATADCLRALGAEIKRTENGYFIDPIQKIPSSAVLNCCESGSTLRFLLPIVGALGVDGTFCMDGRLPQRPLSPLWEEMVRMGCTLTRPTESTIRCTGKLQPGIYSIDGGISSQYITGLLFALSLMNTPSKLKITGNIESKPYIELTKAAMRRFGVDPEHPGAHGYHAPGMLHVEGDWSNGAFWLAAKALGSNITVTNLNPDSAQGDRDAVELIPALQSNITIDASDIPDLVPILSVVASVNKGAAFTNIRRLRLKESDRIATIIEMIQNLGGSAEATDDILCVYGTGLSGGTVDAHNDHRIAMAAAIAATVCTKPVTILGAEAVNKSYPKFWEEYERLGGKYEQYLR